MKDTDDIASRLAAYSGIVQFCNGSVLALGLPVLCYSTSGLDPTRHFHLPFSDKLMVDEWLAAASVRSGKVFRPVCKHDKAWGSGTTEKVVWNIVKSYAARLEIPKLAPHDLRRSCARLCHVAGGELEQIQFLLGHVSVQTTEKYLGCKQRLNGAVNDRIGIEPG